jgi:hypothetical protein
VKLLADQLSAQTGVRVHSLLPIGGDFIVIFDHAEAAKAHLWANLWRVDAAGNTFWRVEAPHSPNYFVNAKLDGNEIQAWTWACYLCRVDASTGKVLEAVFTK